MSQVKTDIENGIGLDDKEIQEQWYAKVNKMLEKYEKENKDE